MKRVIPNYEVRAAFMRRPDITTLPPDEQERRWREHEVKLEAFWCSLTDCEPIVADTADDAGRQLRRRLEAN